MSLKKKKTISIIALVMLIAVSSAVGVTLSFLTYTPVKKVNIFTFSDVSINIVEENWDALDDVAYSKVLYPGRTVSKDPKIENSGVNSLYAYLEVTVPKKNVRTVNSDETVNDAAVTALFSYIPDAENWVELTDYTVDTTEKNTRLFGYKKVLERSEKTSALFENVTFANIVEGELSKGTELDIGIRAYAIQTGSLNEQGNTAEEKVKDAFQKYRAQKTEDDR